MVIPGKDLIFIPFNVPSSKNSRVISSGKGSFHSPAVSKYLQKIGVKSYSSSKKTMEDYKTRPNLFKQSLKDVNFKDYTPLILGYHPVRKTKTKFDLHNVFQIIGDLLTAGGYIEDDNMECLVPIPFKIKGKYYTHNPENPGIYLKVLNNETIKY